LKTKSFETIVRVTSKTPDSAFFVFGFVGSDAKGANVDAATMSHYDVSVIHFPSNYVIKKLRVSLQSVTSYGAIKNQTTFRSIFIYMDFNLKIKNEL
jgi:hypothetical protein